MAADDRGLPVSRRRFVQGVGAVGLGLVTGCGRLPGQSQPSPPKVPTIGWLTVAGESADEPAPVENLEAFRQGLAALGYVEGQSVILQTRSVQGPPGLGEAAADLVRLPVDVIVTNGTPAARAAKAATHTIPIVFASGGNPVGAGLVASLARPGGNVTGLSNQQTDLAGNRLELLREVVPTLKRVAVMGNVRVPNVTLEMDEVQKVAPRIGVEVMRLEIHNTDDIIPGLQTLTGKVDALYVCTDPLITTHTARINTLAVSEKLPTMYAFREYVRQGGLMSYGPNFPDLFRRAGDYVDKILKGVKPADIPVEQPVKFDLIVNLTTAKALGLTIPEVFLVRANEVIE